MSFNADLHLHSRYAYACSKNLTLENIAAWARTKGLDLLATGDFTHPAWLAELRENLIQTDDGTYSYGGVRFVLGTEVSCVYKQGGRGRRLHLLLFASGLAAVERINTVLADRGSKLNNDGRPHVGMSARDFTALVLELDPQSMVVPAHIWTPWYGLLGSKSGFDSLDECFGDMADQVHAVETGLSSDPAMNWGVPGIGDRAIVSFSDAHSLPNLGREITVFDQDPTYSGLRQALTTGGVEYTVEFYPEEGKYHYSGHRNCGVSRSPQETRSDGELCPVCGKGLTLGVLHRVESLSGESLSEEDAGGPAGNQSGPVALGPDGFVRSIDGRPPFLRMAPLEEILSEALGKGRKTKAVQEAYRGLCAELGSEFQVLVRAEYPDLQQVAGQRVAEAVLRARTGQVSVQPGFDGQYGKIRVWPES